MSELGFDGKVVVITGAGRGLGRSHALQFAQRGALVVVNDVGVGLHGESTTESPASELVKSINDNGGTAIADFSDISLPDSAAQLIERAVKEFGRVDVVVNNAGILLDKSFPKMTNEDVERVMRVHFFGSFYVTQAAWPYMKEQGGGRVVMTTSVAGYLGNFGQANYGSAKAALIGLTRTLAIEGTRAGIKVNAIAPGALTRMTENLIGDLASRMDPGFVTPVVVYLAHESCPVSGEVLIVGGGRVARLLVEQNRGVFFRETMSAEQVAEQWAGITDSTQPLLIPDVAAEMGMIVAMNEEGA